jgi:hypothetical protein
VTMRKTMLPKVLRFNHSLSFFNIIHHNPLQTRVCGHFGSLRD